MTEDNVSDLTIEILKKIQADLVEMRGVMATKTDLAELRDELRDEMRAGFSEMRAELVRLEDQTIAGFTGVRAAIDHTNAQLARLIIAAGTRFRRLERGPPRRT